MWEIELESLTAREVATDCAQADYPVNTPCDTQVTWAVCPGSDRLDSTIRSELRPRSGPPRPLAPRSWLLSPSTYLALDEDDPTTLVAVDSAGRERTVLSSIDLTTPLAFGVTPRRGGRATVFSSRTGHGVATADGALRPLPPPCVRETGGVVFTSVSPDGDQMIGTCSASWRTYAIDLRPGGGRVELAGLSGYAGQVTSWSADGRYLLMTSYAPTEPIAIVATRTGEPALVLERSDPELGDVLAVQLAYPAP